VALNFPDSPTVGQVYTDSTSGFSYEWDGVVWKSYSAASVSNIRSIDDISSGFDGTTTTFALTSSGVAVTPLTDNQIIVNLGGVIQNPVDDYNIVGSNILFTTAPSAGLTFSATLLGTSVPIDYATGGNVYERQTYTATAGQTSFTFTSGYVIGFFDVYRNGVRLTSGSDYTATTGSTFVLTTPAQLNDEIEAIAYNVKTFVTSNGNILNLNVAGIATISTNTFINNTGINVTGVVTATSASVDSIAATTVFAGPNIINSTGINVTGVVTATSFSGDGSNLTNTGSTLSAASGSQRLVLTSQTSGTMTASATDGDLTFNAATNTLSVPSTVVGTAVTINNSGINVVGVVTATSFSGNGANLTGLTIPAGFSELDAALFS